jgi:Zn-dependent metalloprotease/PKD repeat protein
MRKILPVLLIVAFPFCLSGQSGNFKIVTKNPSGTYKPGFAYKHTNQMQNLLKSAQTPVAPYKTLSFSGFPMNDGPKVIFRNKKPVFIEKQVTPLKSTSSASNEERFFQFMEETRSITGISDPREWFQITGIITDELGITHVKTVQKYKNVEIYGSESSLHIDSKKERFTGSLYTITNDISSSPFIDRDHGIQSVISDVRKHTFYRKLNEKEKKILKYESPSCELVIYDKGNQDFHLTWEIILRPNFLEEWKYFVDAQTGEIIYKFNNTKTSGPTTGTAVDLNNITRTFNVVLDGGTYYLVNMAESMYNSTTGEGMIITLDANNTSTSDLDYSYVTSTDNAWDQKAAVSAHYNAAIAYAYFKNTFGRNSINGLGGNIISFVNVTEDDGSSMENAFWNGKAIFYGNGGTAFKSLAGALDVSAHELGHGVISNTANLEYYGQSGAMNESYADIFGSMVDRDDWYIGEDVTKTSFSPSGALRDMSNPHNLGNSSKPYWQPQHISEMYLGTQDNGGVHLNSGIGNYAYYLFATSISSKTIAEQIFYRALNLYLTKTSQFIDWRIAVIQSARDLYPSNALYEEKAAEAFDAVGIYDEDAGEDSPDYDTNPGQERLLIYNTDINYTPTLYTSPVSGNIYQPLSSTEMKGKVSATDDGSAAVFVASDSKINVMALDPANTNEHPLSDEAFFDNVAVSKDGKRIAAISTEVDTAIYLYDFDLSEWHKFSLYNPTTSEVNAGGVLYADAIEFDHTGEYLIYDAYNELSSSQSEDISYWDVGFIKVWDLKTDNFGDGSIFKLFTSLPENVSIGNPVFSRNSPNVIAFDYFFDDGINEEYGVYGANLETGELQLITENNTLGYPSFSKADDKVAFAALVSTGTGYAENIYSINLANDKITAEGSASLIMEQAKWPVYYATGDRSLNLPPIANFTADYKTGNAPLQVKFVDLSTNAPTSWLWTFQGGTPSSSTLKNPDVVYNTPGTYSVTLKATNNAGNNTISKTGYIVISGSTPTENVGKDLVFFYPNPVKDKLNIVCPGKFTVKIYNMTGSLLLSATDEPILDMSSLTAGMYLIELHTSTGTYQHKLLKQ